MSYSDLKNKIKMKGKVYMGVITYSMTKCGDKVAWVKLDPRLKVQDVRISQKQLELYQITPDRFPDYSYVMIPITHIGGRKTRYRLSSNGCGIEAILTSKSLGGTELDVSTTNQLPERYRAVGGHTQEADKCLTLLESLER